MNAQATTCPLILPAVIIADCLRELRVFFVGIIYTYDDTFHPVAKLRSQEADYGGGIRKYIYDTFRRVSGWIGAFKTLRSINISLATAVGIRHIYDFINQIAPAIAFTNNRISTPNTSRTARNRGRCWFGRHRYDAGDRQVAPSIIITSQRR